MFVYGSGTFNLYPDIIFPFIAQSSVGGATFILSEHISIQGNEIVFNEIPFRKIKHPTTEQIDEVKMLNHTRFETYGHTPYSYRLVADVNFIFKIIHNNHPFFGQAKNPNIISDWEIVLGKWECDDVDFRCQFIISEHIKNRN